MTDSLVEMSTQSLGTAFCMYASDMARHFRVISQVREVRKWYVLSSVSLDSFANRISYHDGAMFLVDVESSFENAFSIVA